MIEHPLAIQLGGNDPHRVSEAALLCESYANFHEINLNCGCPSGKAIRAGFGGELMLDPDVVRQIVYQMKRKVTHTDITVKCRIGTIIVIIIIIIDIDIIIIVNCHCYHH